MGLKGRIRVPGDKSISHRTLILSSLAFARPNRPSRIRGLLESADVKATMTILQSLGSRIEPDGEDYRVYAPEALHEPADILDADNSGTTIRLMSGVLSAQPFYSVITGDEALRHRPMARVIRPLQEMGARIYGRDQNRYAPMTVLPACEPLHGIRYVSPHASAQVKSAILLAGLFAEGECVVVEPSLSRDHTEHMLRALGIPLQTCDHPLPDHPRGVSVSISGGAVAAIAPYDWQVPGDFSSAAFFIVAALLIPDSEIELQDVNLNPSRIGLLRALESVGAQIEIQNVRESCGEPMGDIVVRSSVLQGELTIDGKELPSLIDEVPILSVAGLFLDGVLTVREAMELRKKESDRIAAMVEAFQTLGIPVSVFEDGFQIQGSPDLAESLFKSGGRGVKWEDKVLSAHRDHRIAMALSVLNQVVSGQQDWTITGREWVRISYPGFYDQLERLQPV